MPKEVLIKEKNSLIKLCDFIITAVNFLIFLLIPLFFTGLVSQGIVFEKVILFYLLILFGIVAWVTKGIAVGELRIKRTPLDVALVVLMIILLVSSIFSVDKGGSFLGFFGATTKSFIAFIAYVAFYYLLINNITAKRIKLFTWALLGSSALIIIYSILQIFGIFILPFAATKTSAFNPIGSSSSLGVFIVAILPFLTIVAPTLITNKTSSIAKKAGNIILRVIVILLVLTSLALLFLLNNFIFWPVAILGIIIVLMFVLSQVITLKQKDMIVPVAVFLFLIFLLVGGNFNLINVQLPTEVSLSRNLSWDIAKASLKENPLFGSGPATFNYAFAKYRGTDFNDSNLWTVRFDTASGNFFEMLVTIGILGAFSLLIVGLIFISIAFISLMKTGNNKERLLLLGIFSSVSVLIINALISAVSGVIILEIVILGSLATVLIMSNYPEKFKEITLSFRSSPKYALALSALFLLVSSGVVMLFTSGFKVYLADFYANQVNKAENVEEAIADLNKAIATFNKNDQYYLQLSKFYLVRANQEVELGQNADVALIQQLVSSAINTGKQAVDLAPNSVVNNESLGLIYENAAVYGIGGSLEWAEKYYNEVISLEPDNPTPYIRLALIKMAQSNQEKADEEKQYFYDEAIKYYKQAIKKKPNLAPAYYGIAIVYERKGDFDKAIKNLSNAVVAAPDSIDYRFELGRLYFNKGVSGQNLTQQQTTEITSNEDDEDVVDEEDLSVAGRAGTAQKNDDLIKAETVFNSILQVSPNHANAIYSLAMMYETLGEKSKAKEYYRKLVDIIPDQATKDVILQKLRNM